MGVVDRLGQDAGGFLRRVKAHRILGHHEIKPPLSLSVKGPRDVQALGRQSLFLQGIDQLDNRVFRAIQQELRPTLDSLGAREQFSLFLAMARLARTSNVEEGTPDVMVAHFDRPFTLVRHMAIST